MQQPYTAKVLYIEITRNQNDKLNFSASGNRGLLLGILKGFLIGAGNKVLSK
jgi:hypothetical protein